MAAVPQALTALARVDAAESGLRDTWRGTTELTLALSQGVPFRVFTLAGPPRLVLDFSEVNFAGFQADEFMDGASSVSAVRFGTLQPGWSRMVLDLTGSFLPQDIGLDTVSDSGGARLKLRLGEVTAEDFEASSGPPAGVAWPSLGNPDVGQSFDPDAFVVVLDPGHGGIDPGAERGGLVEKVLVLDVALQVRDALRREGIDVVLTRDTDRFVSLEARTATAHRAGADVFVSIHADALGAGGASGATVYTLSEEASDAASAQLAARHNRSDILAGLDLTGADDEVTRVLLDLARRETEWRSDALAQSVIANMAAAGGPMNRKPWRQAGFSVLKSADIPSVLVEIGFLSSARDRENLMDAGWRANISEALSRAVLTWRDEDAAARELMRQ